MTGVLADSATIGAPSIEYSQLAPMLVVFGAAVAGVLVEAFAPRSSRRAAQLVLTLGSGSSNKPNTGSSTSAPPAQTNSAAAAATPTTGNLQVSQFQVGDCLTGANLQLNQNTPWPKLSLAVACDAPK